MFLPSSDSSQQFFKNPGSFKYVYDSALGPGPYLGTSHTHNAHRPVTRAMACLQTMLLNVQHEFEGQLRLILEEIAQEHKLDPRALIGKYILRGQKDLSPVTLDTYPVPEGLPAVPSQVPVAPKAKKVKAPKPAGEKKKGGRKPKFSTPPKLDGDLTEDFLKDLTIPLLKEACKMRKLPITGGKDVLIDRIQEHQKNPQAPVEKKKGGRKKKVQIQEPEHNHTLDNKTHQDCPQCETYGNPMDPKMQEETFEIAAPPAVPEAPVVPEIEEVPETTGPKEFEMGEDDIDDQLKNIVAQMNQMEMGSDDEEEIDDDEDPFDQMDYADELEEED